MVMVICKASESNENSTINFPTVFHSFMSLRWIFFLAPKALKLLHLTEHANMYSASAHFIDNAVTFLVIFMT